MADLTGPGEGGSRGVDRHGVEVRKRGNTGSRYIWTRGQGKWERHGVDKHGAEVRGKGKGYRVDKNRAGGQGKGEVNKYGVRAMRRGKRTLAQPREGGQGKSWRKQTCWTIQSQYFSTPCVLDIGDIRNLCTDYDIITNTKLSFLIQ